ncbi:hypothetical protein BD626DRAFT_573982 [Schizophyllum amplum]|uniref:Uncharacterized protein n=1 Tax=Schizophyllum amplum TaxID=97359 RepID=A0A550BZS2_9AGAR|nr:hypothetical protein BD626DRAFT_573982 [Auriculariopsis ampla]
MGDDRDGEDKATARSGLRAGAPRPQWDNVDLLPGRFFAPAIIFLALAQRWAGASCPMQRQSRGKRSTGHKSLWKDGKTAAREALARKLSSSKQAPAKIIVQKRRGERLKTVNDASNAVPTTSSEQVAPSTPAKRRRSAGDIPATVLSPQRRKRNHPLLLPRQLSTRTRVARQHKGPDIWDLDADTAGHTQARPISPTKSFSEVPLSQCMLIQSSPPPSMPPTTSPPPSLTPAKNQSSTPDQTPNGLASDQSSASSANTSSTLVIHSTSQPADAHSQAYEESAPYDAATGPDWRHCSLIAMVAGSKVAFKQQNSIRYTSLGTVKKIISMTGGKFYGHDTRLLMNLSTPSSVLVCGNIGNSSGRITSSLVERLLERHGQRCEKSRLGLVLRFGCSDIKPRLSAFSNIGESFIYPPTIAVFVEERFVDGIRERYEKEDLNYMVSVHALSFPASYFDDVTFAYNAFTTVGDGLMRGRRLWFGYVPFVLLFETEADEVQAAINSVVANGRPFEFAAFKREIARLSKDLPIDETAELQERIRVIESFIARPGTPADGATMFTRELTILNMRDPGVCEEIRQALADLVARKFTNVCPEKAGVPLFEDKVLVVEDYDEHVFRTPVMSQTLQRIMREKDHNRTSVIIDATDPTCFTENMVTSCDIIIAHRMFAAAWLNHLFVPLFGHWCPAPLAERYGRLLPKEAMVTAPGTLLGKSSHPGVGFLGADLMKVVFS